jgi:hypothetical protein
MKYRVYLQTIASFSMEVEVDDDLDQQAAKEAAIEAAYDEAPNNVCAQCTGWGQKWSLDLGGEWEVAKDGDDELVEKVED